MRPTRWRPSTHLIMGAAVVAIVVVLVAAAALFTASRREAAGAHIPPPPTVTAKPGIAPVPDTAVVPTPGGLAAMLAPVLADPNLGILTGRVTDAISAEELWQQQDSLPMVPASTNKTLTAAAALLALDRDARVTTRVVAGDAPGVVVLVGAGDPTLSGANP
ncbi:MAG: D-alanyl-D-alanine carboxypeptidase, partial [Mycobacterium sp.]